MILALLNSSQRRTEDHVLLKKLLKHHEYIMGINTYVGSVDFPATTEWKECLEGGEEYPKYIYMVGEIAIYGLHVHPHGNALDASTSSLEDAELQIVLKEPSQPFYRADFIRGMERLEAIQDALLCELGQKASIGITSDGPERCIRLVHPIFETAVRDIQFRDINILMYKAGP